MPACDDWLAQHGRANDRRNDQERGRNRKRKREDNRIRKLRKREDSRIRKRKRKDSRPQASQRTVKLKAIELIPVGSRVRSSRRAEQRQYQDVKLFQSLVWDSAVKFLRQATDQKKGVELLEHVEAMIDIRKEKMIHTLTKAEKKDQEEEDIEVRHGVIDVPLTTDLAATAPTADLTATAPTADLAVTTAAPTTGATEKDMTTRSKRKSDNTEDETGSNKVFSREAKKRLQERIDRLTDEQLDSVLNFLSFDFEVDEDGVFHLHLDDLPRGKQDDLVKLVDAQLCGGKQSSKSGWKG